MWTQVTQAVVLTRSYSIDTQYEYTLQKVSIVATPCSQHTNQKKWSLEIIIQYLDSLRKHTTKRAESLPPHTTNDRNTRKQKLKTFVAQDDYAVYAFSAKNKKTNDHNAKKSKINTVIGRDYFTVFAFSATNKFQKVRIVATPYNHAHRTNK